MSSLRMPPRNDKRAPFRPLPPTRNRTHELIHRLSAEITGGQLAPGARLPTEQELMTAFGVSRTVLREAVAALRADGLVETRQGIGAFVVRDVQRRPFRIDPDALGSIGEIVKIMELRTGIEIESAGIAAERITRPARTRIARALAAIDAALTRGEAAVEEDFAFHQAIAAATRNPQFTRFLEFLGHFLIPRQSIRIGLDRPADLRLYLARIQHEHNRIYVAIGAGDVAAAREAMREHMMNSRRRYQSLARSGTGAQNGKNNGRKP